MTVTEPGCWRKHWRGGGDVVELIGSTALIASKLLPKRVRRVLTSRVEAPKGRSGKNNELGALLVERENLETETRARVKHQTRSRRN